MRQIISTLPALAALAVGSTAAAQGPGFGPGAGSGPLPDRLFEPLDEVRTIDGRTNNEQFPDRGATFVPFRRLTSRDYSDGVTTPSGEFRPSTRFISNRVFAQSEDIPAPSGISDLFWQWGQFLDHDITETPVGDPAEMFPIPVPAGDPWFDPFGTGAQEIPLSRSFPVRVAGAREQLNAITAWIDGSQIYGSDAERAEALRTMDGTGRLKTSPGDLLPFNVDGLHNAPSDLLPGFFLAGDIRANEQVGLIAMHTLFVREHNVWARRIAREDRRWRQGVGVAGGLQPGNRGGEGGGRRMSQAGFLGLRAAALTGDEIYELARAIVTAELQLITYREWLPILLGPNAVPLDSVYRPELDGTISNEFATAAFRIGHTMLSPQLLRLDRHGNEIAAGSLSLAQAFFVPDEVIATGIEPVLRGLTTQRAQSIDMMLIDDVRNLLFGAPGSGGLDLGALNLQRGRDHGLPSYCQVRRELALGAPASFGQISSRADVQTGLAQVARTPEDLDLWVGGLAEDPLDGALVGETLHAILSEQFRALRDGDRLWYTRQLSPELQALVESQSMARILRRCAGLRGDFAETPFLAPGF